MKHKKQDMDIITWHFLLATSTTSVTTCSWILYTFRYARKMREPTVWNYCALIPDGKVFLRTFNNKPDVQFVTVEAGVQCVTEHWRQMGSVWQQTLKADVYCLTLNNKPDVQFVTVIIEGGCVSCDIEESQICCVWQTMWNLSSLWNLMPYVLLPRVKTKESRIVVFNY